MRITTEEARRIVQWAIERGLISYKWTSYEDEKFVKAKLNVPSSSSPFQEVTEPPPVHRRGTT